MDRGWPLKCLPFPEWCLQMLQNWNWKGIRTAAGFYSSEWQQPRTLVYGFVWRGNPLSFFPPIWDQIVFLWGLHPCGKQQWDQYYEVWMSSLFPNSSLFTIAELTQKLKSQLCNWFFKVLNRKVFFQNKYQKDSEEIKSSRREKNICFYIIWNS